MYFSNYVSGGNVSYMEISIPVKEQIKKYIIIVFVYFIICVFLLFDT